MPGLVLDIGHGAEDTTWSLSLVLPLYVSLHKVSEKEGFFFFFASGCCLMLKLVLELSRQRMYLLSGGGGGFS